MIIILIKIKTKLFHRQPCKHNTSKELLFCLYLSQRNHSNTIQKAGRWGRHTEASPLQYSFLLLSLSLSLSHGLTTMQVNVVRCPFIQTHTLFTHTSACPCNTFNEFYIPHSSKLPPPLNWAEKQRERERETEKKRERERKRERESQAISNGFQCLICVHVSSYHTL